MLKETVTENVTLFISPRHRSIQKTFRSENLVKSDGAPSYNTKRRQRELRDIVFVLRNNVCLVERSKVQIDEFI